MPDHVLAAESVLRLLTDIEESTRATKKAVARFVEPAEGTLRRAKSKQHHIVFGRRGSGKTSLLRKASAELALARQPIAFVDLEQFKGHSYPDVLLSVLIATFSSFKEWLEGPGVAQASAWKRFLELFGGAPTRKALPRAKARDLASRLGAQIEALEDLLHAADDTSRTEKTNTSTQTYAAQNSSAKLGTSEVGHLRGGSERNVTSVEGREVTVEFREKKVEFLLRHIMDYQRLFREMATLADGECFLFLDDLYHIPRKDQPELLDYVHRVAKGNSLWLKVGTIRHRTEWYRHGDPPKGLKLGDEAQEVDLDLTLERYQTTKAFLFKILQSFATANDVALDSIIADGARDRLVLASGGVARDFLTIFRKSVDVARERGTEHTRGQRIGAEDVNVASGDHDQTKRDELKRDTVDERDRIERALADVVQFCTEKINSNCFLIQRDVHEQYVDLLAELVDMRLIHLVRDRLSVTHRQGKAYKAYMLDLSQYTGERKRRDLDLIEFWRAADEDKLRLPKYIYDPAGAALAAGKP